jgi:hypothetical protein
MEDDDEHELTFTPLANATLRVTQQIAGRPREQPTDDDVLKTFQEVAERRSNSNHRSDGNAERRGS